MKTLNLIICLIFLVSSFRAEARRYRRIPTHPIFLWAKTLKESKDLEQRKLAAFKLSKYSQPIYQSSVIEALLLCVKDPNLEIKVFCTKAIGRARKKRKLAQVRSTLLSLYQSEEHLKTSIIESLIQLKSSDRRVYSLLLNDARTSHRPNHVIALMKYFELYGDGSNHYVSDLIKVYAKFGDIRVKTAVVKALGESASGQKNVIALLAACAQGSSTPLQLNCLAGLRTQGVRDGRALKAIEVAIKSNDLDVLEATLDVLDTLPPTRSKTISKRLVEIIKNIEDPEIIEKAVLALGVTGDESQETLDTLTGLIGDKSADEDIRIAAALVVGKQARRERKATRSILTRCTKTERSKSLRIACGLGINELKTAKRSSRKQK